jgi:phosphoglycolate phosphatase-like HAD superfamily hydrolase
MRVLALDFDGVISDSAPESFAVALDTYLAMQPGSRLVRDREAIARGDAWALRDIQAHPLYRAFVEAMPLGNRAEDFGVVLRALDERRPLPDQAAYDVFRDTVGASWLHTFHSAFYARREAFAERDPVGWRALLAPYPAFSRLLRARCDRVILAIVTAKDRPSVERLLVDYGLDDLFAPERVLDKETGVHKRSHITELASRLNVGFPTITFVDDKVNHLDDVSGLGVRCALAAWGYNGPREHRLALERGYAVCELADADAILFGAA